MHRVFALLIWLTASVAWSQEVDVTNPLVFDLKFYARKYPDIVGFYGGNLGAVKTHWVEQGLREGRQSSAVFSIDYYIKTYPDVAALVAAGKKKSAVEHWLKFGIVQGRQASEHFNVKAYIEAMKGRISDPTYERAIRHYLSLPAEKQTEYIRVEPTKPQPMVSMGKEPAVKGVFHMEVDDECTLFVNGVKVHYGGHEPSKSGEVSLKPGDRVLAQLKSHSGPRYLKLLFVTTNRQQMVNFTNMAFKILPDAEAKDFKPAEFNASTRNAREIKRERNPFPFKNKSEYIWGDSDIAILGSILTREMFVPLVL